MHKIYSRFRFKIPKLNYKKKSRKKYKNSKIEKIKIKKIGKILIVFIIAFLTSNTIYNYINPVFINICEGKAKEIATIISNEQATKAIEKYSYEDLFEIEKDNSGKIIMIKSNIITINEIISNVGLFIQKELSKEEKAIIKIPIGSLSGINILSGSGPDIDAKIICEGIVDTDLRSEFISKGINQTIHRVYLQVDCKVSIITSFEKIEENVSNQVLLLENVILGEIPQNYYNLEGIEDPTDIIE